MRAAAIGIGSNSTRLLVADQTVQGIVPVLRQRLDTRLFSALEAGALSQESMMRTAQAVSMLYMRALSEGAETVRLLATSATRDAGNADVFAAILEAACGLVPEVLSGKEEARLSFLGATGGVAGLAGVIDIGGGSTELAVGEGTPQGISLQLGSSRLLKQFGDLTVSAQCAAEFARSAVLEGWQTLNVPKVPETFVCVGGNSFRLAVADRLSKGMDAHAEGWRLTLAGVQAWAARLCSMSATERAQVPGIPESRADVAAHGAVILQAAMEAIGMEAVTVTKRTNLDGALLEM